MSNNNNNEEEEEEEDDILFKDELNSLSNSFFINNNPFTNIYMVDELKNQNFQLYELLYFSADRLFKNNDLIYDEEGDFRNLEIELRKDFYVCCEIMIYNRIKQLNEYMKKKFDSIQKIIDELPEHFLVHLYDKNGVVICFTFFFDYQESYEEISDHSLKDSNYTQIIQSGYTDYELLDEPQFLFTKEYFKCIDYKYHDKKIVKKLSYFSDFMSLINNCYSMFYQEVRNTNLYNAVTRKKKSKRIENYINDYNNKEDYESMEQMIKQGELNDYSRVEKCKFILIPNKEMENSLITNKEMKNPLALLEAIQDKFGVLYNDVLNSIKKWANNKGNHKDFYIRSQKLFNFLKYVNIYFITIYEDGPEILLYEFFFTEKEGFYIVPVYEIPSTSGYYEDYIFDETLFIMKAFKTYDDIYNESDIYREIDEYNKKIEGVLDNFDRIEDLLLVTNVLKFSDDYYSDLATKKIYDYDFFNDNHVEPNHFLVLASLVNRNENIVFDEINHFCFLNQYINTSYDIKMDSFEENNPIKSKNAYYHQISNFGKIITSGSGYQMKHKDFCEKMDTLLYDKSDNKDFFLIFFDDIISYATDELIKYIMKKTQKNDHFANDLMKYFSRQNDEYFMRYFISKVLDYFYNILQDNEIPNDLLMKIKKTHDQFQSALIEITQIEKSNFYIKPI